MSSELSPNQQLVLWHLALHGGKALQSDIQYKDIAKDRQQLKQRDLVEVIRQGRSLALELKDEGWNELAKRSSILPNGRKPSRERMILQLLLNALHGHASSQAVSIGEILRAIPSTSEPRNLQERIRRAFFEIAGNPPQDSVRLSVLRAKLQDVPRQQLDMALLKMKNSREINLINLDNPRDVKAEELSALREGNRHYHVLWIER